MRKQHLLAGLLAMIWTATPIAAQMKKSYQVENVWPAVPVAPGASAVLCVAQPQPYLQFKMESFIVTTPAPGGAQTTRRLSIQAEPGEVRCERLIPASNAFVHLAVVAMWPAEMDATGRLKPVAAVSVTIQPQALPGMDLPILPAVQRFRELR
jgi:hypothetical protein